MEKKGNNKKIIAAAVILLILMVGAVILYAKFKPTAVQGSKAITITVVDDKGEEKVYQHKTDAEYLREAVEEIEGLTVEGLEEDYGLYVKTVNGVYADYEETGTYWAVYINDEYCNYSMDQQPITDGDTFTIKCEAGM